MKKNDIHFYDDIIDLEHHVSKKHTPMNKSDRAAQFGSFAALNGHSDAILETARLTDEKQELTESAIEIINAKLQIIRDNLNDICDDVIITYFKPDTQKSGGAYITHTGKIKKFDIYNQTLLFDDDTLVDINNIIDVQSTFFCADTGFDIY